MSETKLTSNKFVKQFHTPGWTWINPTPVVSAAGTASCCAKNSNYHPMHGRFIYYAFNSTNFWKYDTVTDGWSQLSSPPAAIATYSSMIFRGDMGVIGFVLDATTGTITLPTILSYKGYETFEVQIIRGTGAGQRRVISSQALATVHDSGTPTSIGASFLIDTTKSWTINQWRGHTCRFVNGSGQYQFRRILANDANTLSLSNAFKLESDLNASAASPSPALAITAGAQSLYQIESTVCSVESDWTVTPANDSVFEVRTGGVLLMSGSTNAFLLNYYSVAEDQWFTRNGVSGVLVTNPTDGSIEGPDETWSVMWNGKATAGTSTTLTDSNANWAVDEWVGRWMFIWSGPGEGSLVKITANTQTTLTWVGAITSPTTLTRYRIWSLESGIVTTGGSGITLTDANAAWSTNRYAKAYQVRIVAGLGMGQVRRIVSNTDTVLTLDKALATDTTSVYQIQTDASTLYLTFGLNVDIFRYGAKHGVLTRGFEWDWGVATAVCAQHGEEKPIPIATGTVSAGVCTIVTSDAHGYKTGFVIKHTGDVGASAAANNITATITVTSMNSYTYSVPGSVTNWLVRNQPANGLIDGSKNWTVNEHAGRLVSVQGPQSIGLAPMAGILQVVSNTSDTLTFTSNVTVTGGAPYVIHDREPIGALDHGLATGAQSTTTLQDTNKTWVVNQWAGRYVRFIGGPSQGTMSLITSNTTDTLTFAAATAPVNGQTAYAILAQPLRGAGIKMVLPYNTTVTGDDTRYLYIPRGGGLLGWDIADLTTNKVRPLGMGQQFETLSTGSMYVYDGGDRIYFTKDATNRCYYYNIADGQIYSVPKIPYLVGSAIVGNRMDVVTTKDRLKLLYLNRHSQVEFFKTLLWYQ